ncbi:MAG: glycerol-3-phosphate acyltransferase [Clostridia bacterium]|nr:glycerol-3-phosphate acyltransferase [Clostridia bacterium]
MHYLFSAIVGYGFGCIQASYLISRFFLRDDIREKGNGNAGASNMTLAYGKKYGGLVAVIDILKAFAALWILRIIFHGDVLLGHYTYTAGFFVILGHDFPFFMDFKGGKGTASLIGMLLGLNLILGLVGMFVFVLVSLLTDYIVLGTFGLLLVLLLGTYLGHYGILPLVISLWIVLLSVYKHKKNVISILKGEEKHVKSTLFKKSNE